MKCPKCEYFRKEGETNPEWQCPSCGIAYSKILNKDKNAKGLVEPSKTDSSLKKEHSKSLKESISYIIISIGSGTILYFSLLRDSLVISTSEGSVTLTSRSAPSEFYVQIFFLSAVTLLSFIFGVWGLVKKRKEKD